MRRKTRDAAIAGVRWRTPMYAGKQLTTIGESGETTLSSIQATSPAPPTGIAALAGDLQQPTGQADTVIMRTEGLTKQFGARTAVRSLNLEVRRGDVFALLGPNG